jgi:hypothetical protein
MKKGILIISVLLLSVSLQAQTAVYKIDALGRLHLGDSITVLKTLGCKKKIPIINPSDTANFHAIVRNKNKRYEVFQLLADTVGKTDDKNFVVINKTVAFPNLLSVDTRVKEFYVTRYKVSEDFIIDAIKLRFYDNKLVQIACYASPSIDKIAYMFFLKYGESTQEKHSVDCDCYTNYPQGKFNYHNEYVVQRFDSKIDSVTCTIQTNFVYNCSSVPAKTFEMGYTQSNAAIDKALQQLHDDLSTRLRNTSPQQHATPAKLSWWQRFLKATIKVNKKY